MLLRRFLLLLCAASLLASCGGSQPQLPGFDTSAWRSDPYGCKSVRSNQAKALLAGKEQLYGLRTATIDKMLGRPDEEELAEQTEKIYYYYLEPGLQCEPAHQRSGANKISIRFGSLGTVTEILTDKPLSR
ncbi:hypothetical protein [Hymenobacter psychrotolerans]|uniref:SmpA / OmlA family protein n=1 Tax=Hymenobacter psychrotolerans DSM 18569 TaxID=1121959 RepID=A0A1M6SJP1_9BACT|nr:hypothetical protein [Hymenobacter psychrotolerans]SHK44925.1 hypothetical protein SAMN02746009_00897 [Hymenobacter psychrotolerans DSM 18569]